MLTAQKNHNTEKNTESVGIRTQDLRIKSALLYLLSYTPELQGQTA